MKKSIWERRRYPRLKKVWGIFKSVIRLLMWGIFVFTSSFSIFAQDIKVAVIALVWLAILLAIFPIFKRKPEDIYDQVL